MPRLAMGPTWVCALLAIAAVAIGSGIAVAGAGKSGADSVNRFNGKPYKVYPDGKVDFATYRGFNLYGNICARCHGFGALGTSFAPALANSLKSMSYEAFVTTVINGRVNVTSANSNDMPSFGDNPTIVKYLNSIYAYLKDE